MLKIDFDDDKHEYTVTLEGQEPKVWPGVSQVIAPLKNFSGVVPQDIIERAQRFGIAVHKMVELYNANDLDENLLDPNLVPVLAQYKAAIAMKKWRVLGSEIRVAHPALRYAGTLDLHVEDERGNQAIVDVKTGNNAKTVGIQVMAYTNAFLAMTGESRKLRRYVMFLKKDRYSVQELKDDHTDWSIFVSCLNVLKWKESNP